MEKKKVRCSLHFKRKIIQFYELLGYKLKDEKNLLFSRVLLNFEREEEPSEKVSDVEFKYRLYPSLTIFPMVIGSLIAIVLITLFLIFAFSKSEDKFLYFVYFMTPALALLLLISGYSYVRYSFDSKNVDILTDLNKIRKELGVKVDEPESETRKD